MIKVYIDYISHQPLLAVAGDHYSSKPRIVEGDRCRGRAVQEVKRHAVAPDGSAALDDDKRAAGDLRERGERLGWGDG